MKLEKILNFGYLFFLCLLIFLLPLAFLPFGSNEIALAKIYLLFFLTFLSFLCFLGKSFLKKEIKIYRFFLDFPVFFFLFFIFLSALFSVDKRISLFGFYGKFYPSLIGFFSLSFFYFLLSQAKDKISFNKIFKILTFSVLISVLIFYFSFFGLWQKIENFLGGEGIPSIMQKKGFNPSTETPETYFLFLSLFLLIFVLNTLRKRKISFFEIFSFFFILGAIAIIDVKLFWFFLGSFSFLILIFGLPKKICYEKINLYFLPFLLLVVSFLFFIFSPFKKLPQTVNLPHKISFEIAMNSLKERPILGSGVGTFFYDFSKERPKSFNQLSFWNYRFPQASSFILEIISTLGILGVFSYILLIVYFFRKKTSLRKEIEETGKKVKRTKKLKVINLSPKPFLEEEEEESKSLAGLSKGDKFLLSFSFLSIIFSHFVWLQDFILGFLFYFILGVKNLFERPLRVKKISLKEPEASFVSNITFFLLILLFLLSIFWGWKFYLGDKKYASALKEKDVSQKISLLESAIKLNPLPTQYYISLANAHLERAKKEIKKFPQTNRAVLTESAKKSVDYAKKATEISPHNIYAWETRGLVYREFQNVAKGAEEWTESAFKKCIQLEGTNPVFHLELGKIYLSQNKFKEAEKEFKKALSLKKDFIEAEIQLALLKEKQGKRNEAIESLKKLLQKNPSHLEILFELGRLYYNQGDCKSAVPYLERAKLLFPDFSNARYVLGLCYEKQGKFKKALKEFEKISQLNPHNQEVKQKIKKLKDLIK